MKRQIWLVVVLVAALSVGVYAAVVALFSGVGQVQRAGQDYSEARQ